jgi:bacteriophage N4 adsorption protein B
MENFYNQIAEILVSVYPFICTLAIISGIVFVISGVADLLFDIFFMAHSFRRLLFGQKWKKITLERLEAREQQRIAIFIAAWQESDVIGQTLMHACETIQYRNYDIFVGTYINDPETQTEVDKVAYVNDHVHKVVTSEEGPTNKASNLNHVFRSLEEYENQTGRYYDIMVIHDAEDIIHPYSLLVYNYLIPRMDMIQIPVFPMALPLHKITHWTYADEFAENHTRNMLVRELVGGFVPSAGVGTAFTKRAFKVLSYQNPEGGLSTDTLTEDYQFGLRMNLSGFKAGFVNINIKREKSQEHQKSYFSEWVATRAVFPTSLKLSVRQKTRWNIGIIFQGWQNLGWKGSMQIKWNLFQDRKALIATPISFLSYIVFLYFLIYLLISRISTISMPVLISYGTILYYLVLGSTIFMLWRSINRAYAVNKIYGFLPAITSIPRVIWGNLINFLAVTRGVNQYVINRFRKKEVAWEKTSHEFPSEIKISQQDSFVKGATFLDDREISDFSDHELQDKVKGFQVDMAKGTIQDKVNLIKEIPRQFGELYFPVLIQYIEDLEWEVRAEVCRTLSFIKLEQSIPFLIKAACDPDWIVRANATRAIGKFGLAGEVALIKILRGEDQYASDAALAILEHQGFLQQHVDNLNSSDTQKRDIAKKFLETLSLTDKSQLAKEILKENERINTEERKKENEFEFLDRIRRKLVKRDDVNKK